MPKSKVIFHTSMNDFQRENQLEISGEKTFCITDPMNEGLHYLRTVLNEWDISPRIKDPFFPGVKSFSHARK